MAITSMFIQQERHPSSTAKALCLPVQTVPIPQRSSAFTLHGDGGFVLSVAEQALWHRSSASWVMVVTSERLADSNIVLNL